MVVSVVMQRVITTKLTFPLHFQFFLMKANKYIALQTFIGAFGVLDCPEDCGCDLPRSLAYRKELYSDECGSCHFPNSAHAVQVDRVTSALLVGQGRF